MPVIAELKSAEITDVRLKNRIKSQETAIKID